MASMIELLIIIGIACASALFKKKNKENTSGKSSGNASRRSSGSSDVLSLFQARSSARSSAQTYDPTAPLGSKRNPLGRPGTGAAQSASAARQSGAAASTVGSTSSASVARRNRGVRSFAEMRGDSIFGFPRRAPGATMADDGHRLSGQDDISCRQYGHIHPESDDMPRYVPHNDPEDGYIVLNGKMMLLSEADKYENTI